MFIHALERRRMASRRGVVVLEPRAYDQSDAVKRHANEILIASYNNLSNLPIYVPSIQTKSQENFDVPNTPSLQ